MTLLEMTLSGGLMILLITIIRALALDRLPKRLFLVLWCVTLLRLLIPFSVPFRFSLFSLAKHYNYAVCTSAVAAHNGEIARAVMLSELSVQRASESSVDLWKVLWFIGLGLAAVFFVIAYVRHFRRFRSAETVDNAFISGWLALHPLRRTILVRESGSVTAPLTYGIFRPVILIPTGMDWEDTATLDYAFTHEYTHIRRFDTLLRLLLIAVLCVHWFNPFVWVMYILTLRDIELSCDETVVRKFGSENRRAYALALLKMEETRRQFNVFAIGFSKNAVEERLRAIMKLRKTNALRVIVSAVLVISISAAFCTSAMADSGTLRESPNLIYMSAEEVSQGPNGGVGSLTWTRKGDFIKLEIKGRGDCTLAFFLYCEETNELKGQWITLDGSTHELWLETPADGSYYLWVDGDHGDNYSYKVRYTCYSPNGKRATRFHHWSRYDGYQGATYTRTND